MLRDFKNILLYRNILLLTSAFSLSGIFMNVGVKVSKNVCVATSKAAELESPPPRGTEEWITALNEG